MKRIILHIGANKTASTTLQRGLFSQSPQVCYLGEDCEGYASHRETLNSIVADDDFHYRRQAATALFAGFHNRDIGKTHLYSNEDVMTSRVPSQCADRLAILMAGAQVVMVIRNQLDAVGSFYLNHGAYLKNVPSR